MARGKVWLQYARRPTRLLWTGRSRTTSERHLKGTATASSCCPRALTPMAMSALSAPRRCSARARTSTMPTEANYVAGLALRWARGRPNGAVDQRRTRGLHHTPRRDHRGVPGAPTTPSQTARASRSCVATARAGSRPRWSSGPPSLSGPSSSTTGSRSGATTTSCAPAPLRPSDTWQHDPGAICASTTSWPPSPSSA
jgi:hypothetical protein